MGEFQLSSATRFLIHFFPAGGLPLVDVHRAFSAPDSVETFERIRFEMSKQKQITAFFATLKASDTALQLNIQPASSGDNSITSAEPKVYQPNLEDNIQLTDSTAKKRKLQELDHQGSSKFIFVTF